jgi:hypothetical protein
MSRALWVAGLCGAALFALRAPSLLPVARVDWSVPKATVEARARAALAARGIATDGMTASVTVRVDTVALDALERAVGRDAAQAQVSAGLPIVVQDTIFIRRGVAGSVLAQLHPNGDVLGLRQQLPDDAPAPAPKLPLTGSPTRRDAQATLRAALGVDVTGWRALSEATAALDARTDRSFVFARPLVPGAPLEEMVSVRFAGDGLGGAIRSIRVLPSESRRVYRRAADGRALELIGQLLLAAAMLVALSVFLVRMRDGRARLRPGAHLVAIALVGFGLDVLLRSVPLDPLWPSWLTRLQGAMAAIQLNIWAFPLLFVLAVAGDSLDAEAGRGRSTTLAAFARGAWRTKGVARAAGTGYLLGLLCGGVMAAIVWGLEALVGGQVALQPRGFALTILNSAAPPLASLGYFVFIALVEEVGYRHFLGAWLRKTVRWRWIAVLVPALIYGLTHTTLAFLPPAEPFWGRALVMTAVGTVWGIAYFRTDALTVVLSHLASDLVLFNTPILVYGSPLARALSAVVVLTPLLPLLGHRRRKTKREQA